MYENVMFAPYYPQPKYYSKGVFKDNYNLKL